MSFVRFLAVWASVFVFIGFAAAAPLPGGADPKAPAVDRYGDPLPPFAVDRLGTIRWRHPLTSGHGSSTLAAAKGGKHVLSVGDRIFAVWDTATGRALSWSLGLRGVTGAAFSPSGKSVVTVETQSSIGLGDGKLNATHVRFRDVETGAVQRTSEFERAMPLNLRRNDTVDFERNLLLNFDAESRLTAWDLQRGGVIWRSDLADGLSRLARSPDGSKLAILHETGEKDEPPEILVLEAASGKQFGRIAIPITETPFIGLGFSADGRQLFLGGFSPRWKVVDIAAKRLIGEIDGSKIPIAVSSDGKTMACDRDGKITLHDVATDKEIRTFESAATSSRLLGMAFSPEGDRIVAGERYAIGLWDTATGKRLNPPAGHDQPVTTIGFSPTGDRLATGGQDDCTILWQLDGGKALHRFSSPGSPPGAVAFRPDGQVLAVGQGDDLHLWSTGDGKLLRAFPAHLNGIQSIAFSADGKTLDTSGGDVRVRTWNPATGERLNQIRFVYHFVRRADPSSLFVLSAGYPLNSRDAIVSSWNAGRLEPVSKIESFNPGPYGVRFTRDGATMIGLHEQHDGGFGKKLEFRFWEIATGKERRSFAPQLISTFATLNWAVSPDGQLGVIVEGRHDQLARIRLFDLAAGCELMHLRAPVGVGPAAISPDGKRLATGSGDTSVLLWDLPSARLLGLWSRLGENERPAELIAERIADAVPLLINRVETAVEIERVYSRWTADLGSEDAAVVERARERLASDPASELAVFLASTSHPKMEGRERALKLFRQMTAAQPDDVARISAMLEDSQRTVTYADVKSLGAAAEATYRLAAIRFAEKHRSPCTNPNPFADPMSLATKLPPAAVFRSIRLLATANAPEARRFLQELARGPDVSPFTQAAREALAERK